MYIKFPNFKNSDHSQNLQPEYNLYRFKVYAEIYQLQ